MKFRAFQRTLSLFICLFLLVGCQANPPETAAPGAQTLVPNQSNNDTEIVIEGRVVPKAVINLTFTVAGTVAEVLVQEGEIVEAGQVIARLGSREAADAAVKAAELELLTSEQALQILNENQEEVKNQAFLSMLTARQRVQQAEDYLDSITGDRLQNEIDGAAAQLVIADNRLENALSNYEEYEDEPESDTTRASYRLRLTEAQRAYDEAVRQLDNLNGDGYTTILEQAQNELEASRTQLRLAEEDYDDASQGPDSRALEAAQTRIEVAQASLTASQANLDKYNLRAPVAGTLVDLNLQVAELVSIGQPVAILADLSEWYVETIDLTEIDVVTIRIGQAVQIAADALPEVILNGTVVSIGDTFQEVRGDITYVTRIKVENADSRLKWGMTVLVTFSLQK